MTEAAKQPAKKLTDSEKIAAIVKLLEANGLTIPKELK
jgi:hypothetical protein